MARQLEKTYNPAEFEERLYTEWSEKGYFKPAKEGAEPFTIVMPPPNITGQLHMGHALDNTLQDILIRYKRMCGYNTLWVPGTDHASIATEAKIVEAMKKEGLTKEDLGREGFLERAWEWNRVYGGRITEQLRKIGTSCDWSRQRFTLDEGCSKAVQDVFVNLYNKGLIYRGNRIINWCPHCLTSISDAEVEYEDQAGHFWHLRYPVKDSDEYIYLATTRPETLLGDTAVAVNPKDERYAHLVGKMVILPLVGREIPVVADDYVEMDFGEYGKVILELDGKEAPITTKNFLDLVYSDFYNGLTIFRAQRGFVIQGGENEEINLTPIKGEFSSNGVENNITHIRGVISMARTKDPNSATSQFFITLDDSAAYSLDGDYAGFGRVIEGMDVVDSIANDLFNYGGYMGFVDDAYAIEIKSAKIIDYKK